MDHIIWSISWPHIIWPHIISWAIWVVIGSRTHKKSNLGPVFDKKSKLDPCLEYKSNMKG